MAAVPSDLVPAGLELRSATLSLIAVVVRTLDLDALAVEIAQRARLAPALFDDEPVAIDLSNVHDAGGDAPDFPALMALLKRHRMQPIAVRGGNPLQMAAAHAAGLIEAPEGRAVREALIAPSPPRLPPPPPPLIVDRPLRSGQRVHARDRDLIVLALVSHGAEVVADGHCHVYAPLRGRAFAGAAGDTDARIFATTMEPQLLSIAGVVRTSDPPLPTDVTGRVAMARLVDGELQVEPLQQQRG